MRGVLLVLLLIGVAGCDLFSPRDPETPMTAGGTFLQPDTPEQVVENIQAAIAELNTPNYSRSLDPTLEYFPTARADASDPAIWSSWAQSDEERYFSSMAASAQFASNHELRLNDQNVSLISDTRYELDASYVLTVNHNRPDVGTTVQGRLIWVILQGEDGLWRLQQWTDREVGGATSWSDLKAEFVK